MAFAVYHRGDSACGAYPAQRELMEIDRLVTISDQVRSPQVALQEEICIRLHAKNKFGNF
jgi:hypothetical protein